jgi:hypothetical protein
MKVHYKPVIQQLREAIEHAVKYGHAIEYIELTAFEWSQMSREWSDQRLYGGPPIGLDTVFFLGVELRKAGRA